VFSIGSAQRSHDIPHAPHVTRKPHATNSSATGNGHANGALNGAANGHLAAKTGIPMNSHTNPIVTNPAIRT